MRQYTGDALPRNITRSNATTLGEYARTLIVPILSPDF